MDKHKIEYIIKGEILKLAKRNIVRDEITEETNLMQDLGFDSVLIVRLMLQLEEIFDILFEDEDIKPDTFLLYKNICNIIQGKTEGNSVRKQ